MFLKGNYADEIDKLQSEFCALQIAEIPPYITSEERTDVQWHCIGKIKNDINEQPYKKFSDVMLEILSIPHSNAELWAHIQFSKKN